MKSEQDIPIQSVERPILCAPYVEPNDHWIYEKGTGQAKRAGTRRPAGYWYKTEKTGSAQQHLFVEEERDDLPLVNLLRDEVRRWREADYRGASSVTKDLLRYWAKEDRPRRLFFCQREAVETIIYLAELRIPGKSSRTGFHKFPLSDEDLGKLLRGEKPGFDLSNADFFPTLVDPSGNPDLIPLRRLGCKMATGSGKTVVMSMLIAWAFCNRGQNLASREFPNAVIVCCPNLTVKERLQVLRPEVEDNYYAAFDIVPAKYRPLLQVGKVLVTNWHAFAPESEHKEGDKNYPVVNKGPETAQTFARRVLGDLYDRMPIMVLNDEGHHCWRPAVEATSPPLSSAFADADEIEEARIWARGLDWLNNAGKDGQGQEDGRRSGRDAPSTKPGIALCVDLSATPFYIKGSGHSEGRPFPWLVSDFGLVDAIESGIVKIPRLPVLDTTGRPDPKYFRLWRAITDGLQPAERLPGRAGRPKPDVVYREAEAALKQIAGQWVERFKYIQQASPGQERVPPVLILVCDNTDIAEVFFRKISGESEEEIVTEADVRELEAVEAASPPLDWEESSGDAPPTKKSKLKTRTVYGKGAVFPTYLSNTATEKRTIRIDTKLLAEAESGDPDKKRKAAAEELRRVVATVGKPGQPGEHVRCVVSVSMLTEGWDANNVTHVLGIRAFGSQLLCEQVVGRGLRRMDYTPDPRTGLLTEEYVDVYGIPFSVIPFKGRPIKQAEPDDRPKNHVKALEERKQFEMRFPVVEGYAFALRRNAIRCDIGKIEPLIIEPNREPTATFLQPTVGFREGSSAQAGPFAFVKQNRQAYYNQTHLQEIQFQIAKGIVDQLTENSVSLSDAKRRALKLQSRHQLFPQVLGYVQQYVGSKIDFRGENPCELGLEKYVTRTIERLRDAILPDDEEGEPPLLPILNRYKPLGTTAEVNFKTMRVCWPTQKSPIDQIVLDTETWESSAGFRLEQCGAVNFYARNDHLGLTIPYPYEYQGIDHAYEPDFLVRLINNLTVVLEIKGYEDDQTRAKHNAARRWVDAVNNWRELGRWYFHVCRDPQILEKELAGIGNPASVVCSGAAL